ncbi:hypothetical protein [Metamycoplasma hominis]|uniref:hypothetical protein n=1 Tax=Metamycoplasma hominis TaxID=2098 RepID=UPI002410E656|nr:hypothetical protein [Metamycoplasma hominis]
MSYIFLSFFADKLETTTLESSNFSVTLSFIKALVSRILRSKTFISLLIASFLSSAAEVNSFSLAVFLAFKSFKSFW